VEARLLPGTTSAVSPFWSPDSKSLAFGNNDRLMRVDISGGPPQVVCESKFAVGSGFWTEDGEIVFGPRNPGLLQRVKAAGGIPQPVTALLPDETFHAFPSLLPDGRHFLYLISGAKSGVYVGSLDAKPDQQGRVKVTEAQLAATFVRSRNSAGGDLFFVRDGTLMAQPFDPKILRLTGDPIPVVQQIGVGAANAHFSVTAGGVLAYRIGPGTKTQLAWVDREAKVLNTVEEQAGPFVFISLSPDEKQVAIFRADRQPPLADGDIWLLDLMRNIETRLTTGQAVRGSEYGPVWSPDGKRLAYSSADGIYVKDAGGATDAKLVKYLGHPVSVTDWTHDGRFLIYDDQTTGSSQIRELAVSGGDPITVVGPEAQAWHGRISPDAHWIAYDAMRTPGPVYVRPYAIPDSGTAPAGPVIQISRGDAGFARWSVDGNELLFQGTYGRLMSARIDRSGGGFLPEAPVLLGLQFPLGSGLALSRNQQRFLAVMPLDQGALRPITVVTNWEASLKPR
jgi:eukaryotic-like serine/threonine-protein kinase